MTTTSTWFPIKYRVPNLIQWLMRACPKAHSPVVSLPSSPVILPALFSPLLDMLSTLLPQGYALAVPWCRYMHWCRYFSSVYSHSSLPHLLHLCSKGTFSIKPTLTNLSKITLPHPIKCAYLCLLFTDVILPIT